MDLPSAQRLCRAVGAGLLNPGVNVVFVCDDAPPEEEGPRSDAPVPVPPKRCNRHARALLDVGQAQDRPNHCIPPEVGLEISLKDTRRSARVNLVQHVPFILVEDSAAPEHLLGVRLRATRLVMGWSQEDVARKMQAAGFNWFQSTVAKTEASTRPVRVNEAVAIAHLLGAPIEALVGPSDDLASVRRQAVHSMYLEARQTLQQAHEALEEAQARVDLLQSRLECLDAVLAAISRSDEADFRQATERSIVQSESDNYDYWHEDLYELGVDGALLDKLSRVVSEATSDQLEAVAADVASQIPMPDLAGASDG